MLQAETRVILNERIMLDEAQARAAQAETRQGEGDINTDDDDDDTAEYEHWHRREMARIARSASSFLFFLLRAWSTPCVWLCTRLRMLGLMVVVVCNTLQGYAMLPCTVSLAALHMTTWKLEHSKLFVQNVSCSIVVLCIACSSVVSSVTMLLLGCQWSKWISAIPLEEQSIAALAAPCTSHFTMLIS